jgi:glucokinase
VVGDRIIEGEHSHGGELGHLRIDRPDTGRRCGCGARGCLEAYASASSVVERARDELASWRGHTELKQYQTVFDHDKFNSKVIFDLAEAGDECAKKVVDDTAYYLALGACAAIAVADPEVIVIGGGMAKSKLFLAKVDEYVRRFGLPYPTQTDRYATELGRKDLPKPVRVVFAEMGETAGYIGAAGCARALASGGR